MTEARTKLSVLTPEAVNALVGRDVTFKLADQALPFTTQDLLMSFSLPNFFFHATKAYDILRRKGAASRAATLKRLFRLLKGW